MASGEKLSQKKKGREEKKKMGEQGTDFFTRLQENSFGRIIQRHKVCASNMEHILENDLDLSNFYVEKNGCSNWKDETKTYSVLQDIFENDLNQPDFSVNKMDTVTDTVTDTFVDLQTRHVKSLQDNDMFVARGRAFELQKEKRRKRSAEEKLLLMKRF